jgi:hypothetical protein
MDYQDSTFEVRPGGDYLDIVCMPCRTDCELDFQGRDARNGEDRNQVPELRHHG